MQGNNSVLMFELAIYDEMHVARSVLCHFNNPTLIYISFHLNKWTDIVSPELIACIDSMRVGSSQYPNIT